MACVLGVLWYVPRVREALPKGGRAASPARPFFIPRDGGTLPKRLIDYEAIYSSKKLFNCAYFSRVEYLWIYGLADAGGSFELTDLRLILPKLSTIRPKFTLRLLKNCLDEYQNYGLLFSWYQDGKKFGHWVGSQKPGRLPSNSTKSRYYLVCPQPPKQKLAEYESRFNSNIGHDPNRESGHAQDVDLDLDLDGIRMGIGFGSGTPAEPVAIFTGPASAQSVFPSDSIQSKPQATTKPGELSPRLANAIRKKETARKILIDPTASTEAIAKANLDLISAESEIKSF
jgi:hypothetical protein